MKAKIFNGLWSFLILSIFILGGCSSGDDNDTDDLTLPLEVVITSPQSGETLSPDADVPVKLNIDRPNDVAYVKFFINGVEQHYVDAPPYEFTWHTSSDDFPEGNYTIKVEVLSKEERTTTKSVSVEIQVPLNPMMMEGRLFDRVSLSPITGYQLNVLPASTTEILFSTTTSADGTFSYTHNEGVESGHYIIGSQAHENYIPVNYGFDFNQETSAFNFELYSYPKAVVNKQQDDFIKGVSLFDAGPWMAQDLYPDEFVSTFSRLENMNANLVTVFDPVFVTEVGHDSVKMDISANTTYEWDMLSNQQYATLTANANDYNLNFMWWFGVWPQEEKKLDGESFNQIVFSGAKLSDEFWYDWFSEYSRILVSYAQKAEELGVKYISLGHGLTYATSPFAFSSEDLFHDLWGALVQDIRNVYSGKIVYFGMCRSFNAPNYEGGTEVAYFEDSGYTETFKDLFDAFGIIVSNIINKENPTVAEIKSSTVTLLDRYTSFGKPIILWVWAPSVTGAAMHYGHLEPVLDVSTFSNNFTTDFYAQADIYEGILQAINETSTQVAGVISHGYHYNDNFYLYEPRNMVTAFDKAASVRQKPAEVILRYWFGGY